MTMNDLFYHHLGAEVRDVVQDHATAIRDLMRQAVEPISEIGRRLIECKQVLGHGKWKKWLDREFQWSQDTAERFMSVVRITDQIPHGAEFDKSALYILANEKTPEEAVKEARERAAGGEEGESNERGRLQRASADIGAVDAAREVYHHRRRDIEQWM